MDWTGFLDRWQWLIGSMVGGLISLAVALIVAGHARRQQERSAALLLVADLNRVTDLWAEVRREMAAAQPDDGPVAALRLLHRYCPELSPLYDASMAQLVDRDPALGRDLGDCRAGYLRMHALLGRLAEEIEFVDNTGSPRMHIGIFRSEAARVTEALSAAAERAGAARGAIQRRVLGRLRWWHRHRPG